MANVIHNIITSPLTWVVVWALLGAIGSFSLFSFRLKNGDVPEVITAHWLKVTVLTYLLLVAGGPGMIVMDWIARIDYKLTGKFPEEA